MSFRIVGLSPEPFRHLYGLSDAELASHGARRVIADGPGFPDRIEMRDLNPGKAAILLNYTHQPANTPYHASHAIFVREGAERAYVSCGEVPELLRTCTISLRAFDDAGEMLDADLVDGAVLEPAIEQLLADPRVAYLHAHYARRGCYAALIERA